MPLLRGLVPSVMVRDEREWEWTQSSLAARLIPLDAAPAVQVSAERPDNTSMSLKRPSLRHSQRRADFSRPQGIDKRPRVLMTVGRAGTDGGRGAAGRIVVCEF